MIVSFTGSLTRSFASNGDKPDVAVLKVDQSGSLTVNGSVIEPNRDGIATVRLTPTQTAAFGALMADREVAKAILSDTREFTLPDAHKGRHVTLGDDLLSAILAEESEEGAEEGGETPEETPEETPVKAAKAK